MQTYSVRAITSSKLKQNGRINLNNDVLKPFEGPSYNSLKTRLRDLYWSSYLPDVELAFNRIGRYGSELSVFKGEDFPKDDYKRLSKIHFQGIQRLKQNYVVISGSSGHLFFVELGSRDLRTPHLRSNVLINSILPGHDKVINVYRVPSTYAHLGGFQIIDDYLVIGAEDHGRSEVLVLNIHDPRQPRLVNKIIRDHDTAGAVGIAFSPVDKKYVIAVGNGDSKELSFYKSRTSDLETTDFEFNGIWKIEENEGNIGLDEDYGKYQSLNLISQRNGKLYLVGFHRNDKFTVLGDDWADLFVVDLMPDNRVAIRKCAKKHMICQGKGNFEGGAGVYFDGVASLLVYAVSYALTGDTGLLGITSRGDMIGIEEFRSGTPSNQFFSNAIKEQAWVELYKDKDYEGDCVFIDYLDRNLRDYSNYDKVGGFEDKVSSIRWYLPESLRFELFEDKNFKGKKYILQGTGLIEEISDFGLQDWNDKVSSSRFVDV